MDTIDLEQTIRQVLDECIRRYATPDARMFLIFDPEQKQFLIVEEGWNGSKRIHSAFVHIELRPPEVWIQQDYTNHGIANDLAQAGVAKSDIVLAYKPPALRVSPEYAVA